MKYITISREYGSGGRTIGKLVAQHMGWDFYDSEIIDMAAEQSGLARDFIKKTEQNISSSWLYSMMIGSSYATGTAGTTPGSRNPILPLADQVFNAQRKTILQLIDKGPCVLVGRCADYILATSDKVQKDELLNVFVYAPLDDRVERAVREYNVPQAEARRIVQQIDKRRANHYNTFTENCWGKRNFYELMINSSLLGLEGTAELIAQAAKNA